MKNIRLDMLFKINSSTESFNESAQLGILHNNLCNKRRLGEPVGGACPPRRLDGQCTAYQTITGSIQKPIPEQIASPVV